MIHHTIQHAAQRFPEREAFRCGKVSLSFAQIEKKSNQMASLLLDLGVRKGDRIGVHLNRSIETAVAIFGIMKVGAAYVPLDPNAPASRTRTLILDCGIEQLIANTGQIRSLQKVLAETIALKSIIGIDAKRLDVGPNKNINCVPWSILDDLSDQAPNCRILEQDLAYIIYTSGSTGVPKGIMHTHYSGLNYAKLSADLYQLNENDRVANHAPLHFDVSTFGYFAAPLVGATTVIIPDAYTKMPASLSQLIATEKISVWYSVPLALVQLLQRGILEERDTSALRWVLYAGEPFPTKYLRLLMQQWPHTRFSNIYGPAETNQCTYYNIPGPPETDDPIPLGHVWNNTEMLIMDSDDQATPRGEIGELLIRSGTSMKGYWKQPALTKKAFYTRTIVPEFEERFYRTGDLVQLNEEGLLLFMGRKDRQIKTRGYRVELDEVEAKLVAHDSIHEAAVIPIKTDDSRAIVASVILKENQTVTAKEFTDYLAQYLPWYAVPQHFDIRPSFPRTSTGKIDRPALQKQVAVSWDE